MSPERYELVARLFLEARLLPPDRRESFLDGISRCDEALRGQLEQLLAHDGTAADRVPALAPFGAARVLSAALADTSFAPALDEPAAVAAATPRQIGRYRIVRHIGQGGMGSVFEAEQDDPRRRVALKLIRDGSSSPALTERFHREAQMLGRLCHRGIAQIYDAHTSPTDGEPHYIAMELVDGPPLLRFALDAPLDLRQRLQMVAEVCDALDHAHQQGLVHRDLKPGNILVQPRSAPLSENSSGGYDSAEIRLGGQPKILDFGIARSADLNTLTEAEAGRLIGTVPYMSPEQAAGQRVDARGDVYSVGVIAFELLTGRLPYDLGGKMIHEAARIIRDDEPMRLGAIDRRLRGDIEVIIAKALEKDREQRYAGAAELAADIRRHLSDQPIVARPPSALYRMGKFVRRRKALAGGAAIAAITTLIAGTITLVQIRAAGSAEAARSHARTIADREEWLRYASAIRGAAAAVDNCDPSLAKQFLQSADVGHGTWEYRFVRSRFAAYGELIEADSPIVTAAFSMDGSMLFTAERDGRINRWDARTSEWRGAIPLTETITGPADFSTAARRLVAAVGPAGADVVVWDGSDGAEIARLSGEEVAAALRRAESAPLTAIAASPDGLVAAIGAGGGVLWQLGDGERCGWMEGAIVQALAFTADAGRVVCGYKVPTVNNTAYVRALDACTASFVDGRPNFPYRVPAIAPLGAGERVLVGTGKNGAKITALKSAKKGSAYGGDRGITAVAIDPRGDSLDDVDGVDLPIAVASLDEQICFYQRRSQKLLRAVATPGGRVSHLEYASNGARLAAVSGRLARIYRVDPIDAQGVLCALDTPVGGLAVGGGAVVVCVDSNGAVQVIDQHADPFRKSVFSISGASCHAIAPDASMVASGHDGGIVRVWSTDSDRPVNEIALDTPATVAALAVSRTGDFVAARAASDLVAWDRSRARVLWRAHVDGPPPGALTISADGALLAATTAGGAGIWRVEDGACIGFVEAPATVLEVLAFSPDGERIAAGSRSGALFVWSVRSGASIAVVKEHEGAIRALAFSPGGARLVSGGADSTIVLWDCARWDAILELREHGGAVSALSFSADGSRLVSGSADRTIRYWDAPPAPTDP